jgi:hypothetical protein
MAGGYFVWDRVFWTVCLGILLWIVSFGIVAFWCSFLVGFAVLVSGLVLWFSSGLVFWFSFLVSVLA